MKSQFLKEVEGLLEEGDKYVIDREMQPAKFIDELSDGSLMEEYKSCAYDFSDGTEMMRDWLDGCKWGRSVEGFPGGLISDFDAFKRSAMVSEFFTAYGLIVSNLRMMQQLAKKMAERGVIKLKGEKVVVVKKQEG